MIPSVLIASFLFITSQCYFAYTHDARPDMLYTFLCTPAITGFIYALKGRNKQRIFYAHLTWLAYALAILTKGPQLPAIIFFATIIFLRIRHYSWHELMQII